MSLETTLLAKLQTTGYTVLRSRKDAIDNGISAPYLVMEKVSDVNPQTHSGAVAVPTKRVNVIHVAPTLSVRDAMEIAVRDVILNNTNFPQGAVSSGVYREDKDEVDQIYWSMKDYFLTWKGD